MASYFTVSLDYVRDMLEIIEIYEKDVKQI